jgi:hypothetical protein
MRFDDEVTDSAFEGTSVSTSALWAALPGPRAQGKPTFTP